MDAGARSTEEAGAAELADDLRRGVDDRRAAAAAVDGAGDVAGIDALAARPTRAGAGGGIHVVLRVDLGSEPRVADPEQLRAVGVGHGRAGPAQEDRARRRVGVQVQEREVHFAVRRRDDADVRLDLLDAAHPAEPPLLEDAEDLRLEGRRHVPDLVEEERAAVRELHEPLLGPLRVRERALLIAEELAFEEVLGERAAVHLDEGALAPRAPVVDLAREELLQAAPRLGGPANLPAGKSACRQVCLPGQQLAAQGGTMQPPRPVVAVFGGHAPLLILLPGSFVVHDVPSVAVQVLPGLLTHTLRLQEAFLQALLDCGLSGGRATKAFLGLVALTTSLSFTEEGAAALGTCARLHSQMPGGVALRAGGGVGHQVGDLIRQHHQLRDRGVEAEPVHVVCHALDRLMQAQRVAPEGFVAKRVEPERGSTFLQKPGGIRNNLRVEIPEFFSAGSSVRRRARRESRWVLCLPAVNKDQTNYRRSKHCDYCVQASY